MKISSETEEIKNFYESLIEEKKTFQTPLEEIFNSEIIVFKNENNGKIIGIAGIKKHRMVPLVPFFFIVVKSEFQGKGIGERLLKQLLEIAKKKHSFIIIAVFVNNKHAIALYKKYGFTTLGMVDNKYCMVHSFNIKGKIVSKFLTLIIPLYKLVILAQRIEKVK